jgi:DNA-binding response OmpR family regulator
VNEGAHARCVLVLEDSMALAMLLKEALPRYGYSVLLAARVGKGVILARTEAIDAAILDINIAGERVYPVAAELVRRGIPFFFASGYGAGTIDRAYAAYEVVLKPYGIKGLAEKLAQLLER